ncbi:hypothetical protein [Zymomonas mobilis]|uniref:hypothetical protein n=1 Tax=Zymomonas mobilis TaxID=542 RepID=UPI0021AB80DD|nr:hypothetical protein [Zymomonas mobilis]
MTDKITFDIGTSLQQIQYIADFLQEWCQEKQASQAAHNPAGQFEPYKTEIFSDDQIYQLNQAYKKAPALLTYQAKILLDECLNMAQAGVEVLIKARQAGASPALAAGSLASAIERDIKRMHSLLLSE